MVDIRKEFPRRYLTAADLGDERLTVQIVDAEVFTFKPGDPPALMLTVRSRGEPAKQVRCNQTNRNALSAAWGFNTDGWMDRQIELSVVSTQMGPGIRMQAISDDKDTAAAPAAPPGVVPPAAKQPHRSRIEDDEVPF